MKKTLIAAALAGVAMAQAKIPAPVLDDAAKAKAAETAAKTAWQGKVDLYQLCKAQDRVAAYYRKTAASAPAAAKPAMASASAAPAAKAAASGASAPVAAGPAAPAACVDPGPFAYTPPEQKPLEASGAHSPPGMAVSPPSTAKPQAEAAPVKPAPTPAKKT